MGEIIRVGMADLNICKSPDVITTLGLGSCIGLVFYDPVAKVGGMVHYMLPDSTKVSNNSNKAKFADTGIEELLTSMVYCVVDTNDVFCPLGRGGQQQENSHLRVPIVAQR